MAPTSHPLQCGLRRPVADENDQITAFGVAPPSTPILCGHGNNTGATAARGNGNIINDGKLLYEFDALNRLMIVRRKSDGMIIGSYLYDALNRRINRVVTNGGVTGTIPDGWTRFLLDGQQIVELGAYAGPST